MYKNNLNNLKYGLQYTWACKTNTHLLRDAVQHQLSRTVCSTNVQQDISRSLEVGEVLSLVQILWPANRTNYRYNINTTHQST